MIPKKIHYCWFGGSPLPESAKKCIASWEKYLPDYEIKEWNESNFDVNCISYTKEAYASKKYAFVSDYARFKILYDEGGIYFDTDVEVIKQMDAIICEGPFMGCERDADPVNNISIFVAPGLGLGVTPGHVLYGEIIEVYNGLHFIMQDGKMNLRTVVDYTTEILVKYGLKNIPGIQKIENVLIYPSEYFCPKSVVDGKLRLTANSYTVHHFDQSWQSPWRKYGRKLVLFLGGDKAKTFAKRILQLK